MSDLLEANQLFFCNLALLGFDAVAMERTHRIPFNKDMFLLPNKKGFETVVYFLFSRFDANSCKERFRDCWPISNKKDQQSFCKVCTAWFEQISKDNVNAYLPHIGVSSFMSPGGDKFCQFLFCFSRYVLFIVAASENGERCPADFQSHTMLTPQTTTIECSHLQRDFISKFQLLETLQAEWLSFTDEFVTECRDLTKYIRALELEIKSDMIKASKFDIPATGSPGQSKRSSGTCEHDQEIQTVRETQVLQQVHGMWKSFEEFRSASFVDPEIVESILHQTVKKYQFDLTAQTVGLPDILLRECEQEILKGNVYKEGKFNLLRLVELSNLAFNLYIKKMHEVRMQNVDDFLPELSDMSQTGLSLLATTETRCCSDLECELLPEMKKNIEQLMVRHDERFAFLQGWLSSSAPSESLKVFLVDPGCFREVDELVRTESKG